MYKYITKNSEGFLTSIQVTDIPPEQMSSEYICVPLTWEPQPEKPKFRYDYNNNQYIELPVGEKSWAMIREERDILLSNSDWTQLPDVPLSTQQAWQEYRQALRDITNYKKSDIVWPVPPGANV